MPSKTHVVVIPTYNTGPAVIETVTGALSVWTPVWVVVDGSDDGTAEALIDLAALNSGLRVLRHEENRGKGAAVLTGAITARKEGATHILTMDADGQHSLADLRKLMECSLAHPGSLILGEPIFDESAPAVRVHGRKLSNLWANIETLWGGIHDSLFGYRVYPADELIRVMHSTRFARRFDFDVEAAVRLVWRGVPVINVPTPVRYLTAGEGGVSQFRYLRDNTLLTWMHFRLLIGCILRLPVLLYRRLRPCRASKNSETRRLHRKLVSHYEGQPRRHYVRSKLATDPLYDAVFEILRTSDQDLLDIGCGMGLLALYLRARGFAPPITGVDYDERKIQGANAAIARTGHNRIRFVHGDARDTLPDFRGNVSILDVLQFMPMEAQADLLQRCAAAVTPGGALVIRSGLQETGWRFSLTRFGDAAAKWTRWMKDAPNSYPTKESLREVLEAEGLEGTFTPLWGRTPFNNYLIVFRRPAGSGK